MPDHRLRHRRHLGQHRVPEGRSNCIAPNGSCACRKYVAGCRCRSRRHPAVAKPRDPGVFTIKTTDAAGAPVTAQVSLAVIDEAVFAVKPDEHAGSRALLLSPRVQPRHRRRSRANIRSSATAVRIGLTLAQKARRRPLALADFKGDKEARPHVRKEFPDAIYWVADLTTDETGTATAKVTYPDALTTWRLTARGDHAPTPRAGSTLSRTTTTKDVILRVITPRFLTEGDTRAACRRWRTTICRMRAR